jgi:hypothetical protein
MATTKGKKGEIAAVGADGETTSGYFRRIFKENPKLLNKGTNSELFEQWLKDHPGQQEVPDNVKAILHNVKSVLRKKRRQRRAEKAQATPVASVPIAIAPAAPALSRRGGRSLEQLEAQIDDCLASARGMDREGLAPVIELLRQARNEVVRQAGA